MGRYRIFYISAILFFCLLEDLTAQDYVFRVLANKGGSEVQTAGSQTAKLLKTGQKLRLGDRILASQDAYIGLVHHSGKTIELNKPGSHSVASLEGMLRRGKESLSSRYMKLVISKLNERGILAKRAIVHSNVGAVERASGYGIDLLIKETKSVNRVLGDNVSIRWQALDGNPVYVVTIRNVFDQVLLQQETMNNKYKIDFKADELQNERFYIVGIKLKNDPTIISRDYGLSKITPSMGSQLLKQLEAIRKELPKESAMNRVVYASFFEANNLHLEALDNYMMAVELSPQVIDFRQITEGFILENDLGK